ncbi:BREX-1 system adenine-specific DNA-methyltransferase PglX [Vagococcus fluvialis]|uniref:BREX-1 system adenine-specific DNA-methyltransferase PglX n=1 Tax=Vagococcus fluvialis TaxID=2738 RepID=UPI003B5B6D14
MDKKAIKNFAIESRQLLRLGVINKLAKLGITDEKIEEINTIDKHLIEIPSNGERFEGKDVMNRTKLVNELNSRVKQTDPNQTKSFKIAFETLVEEVAYTWFNRLIAIRFMEVNNYLPERQRVLSSETIGKKEPDIITNILRTTLYQEMDETTQNKVINLLSDSRADAVDELYQLVFIRQCNSLNRELPDLFETIDDYSELLISISYIDDNGVIASLLTIPESDFDVTKEGQVEIIGWMYQYYNTEPKDKVFARGNRKIRADEIPAATQLFTPDWIVRYMVENSLGRYYIDQKLANPNETRTEKEIAESFDWKYYLESAEQPEEVKLQIINERQEKNVFDLQELKLLDNAMGSGHILVYAFDVFLQLYVAEGFRERDAAELIMKHNLFGLEIDKRAYQLAYFAIMMKGRQYSRRILSKGIKLNVHYFIDLDEIPEEYFSRLEQVSLLSEKEFLIWKDELKCLLNSFKNATEIGSVLNLKNTNLEDIINIKESILLLDNFTSMDILYTIPEIHEKVIKILNIMIILLTKYSTVITNPPYLNKMSLSLDKYVKSNYPSVKTDLFSVFIKMNSQMLIQDGYAGFMTPFVWMFIKSYEELRKFLINNKTISSLIQMEYSAFEEATVPVCCFTIKNTKKEPIGNYLKLSDFRGGMHVQKNKVLEAIIDPSKYYFYQTNQKNFEKIPGNPISFWVSENLINTFSVAKRMDEIVSPKQGLATANNDRFLRQWWEVDINKIKFDAASIKESVESGKKWFPYNKGGAFRRWYGNYDYVVNWENDGQEIRNFVDSKGKQRSRPQNTDFYFKEAITWSDITSSKFSLRYREAGSIHDVKGMEAFEFPNEHLFYILGVLNTGVGNYIFKLLNPTISLQIGNFQSFPILINEKEKTEQLSIENLETSKIDWNALETAWGFKKNSLI